MIGVPMHGQDLTDRNDFVTPWFPRQSERDENSVQVPNMANTTNDLDTFKVAVQTKTVGEGDNGPNHTSGT